MSRPIVVVQLDSTHLSKDTPVEVTSTGEVDLPPAAPLRTLTTAGALAAKAAQGFCDTLFDPSKSAEFAYHQSTLDSLADSQAGVNDILAEVPQPPSGEKIADAAKATVKNKPLLQDLSPVAFEQVNWTTLEEDLRHLDEVTQQKLRLERRAANFTILQAHLRQRLYTGLQAVHTSAQSAIETHRGLAVALEPLEDLFSGAANQGVETKKTIQRAVAKALKDVEPPAKEPVVATAGSAAAPTKDVPRP